MKFRITLTDDDCLKYNEWDLMRTPHGRKIIAEARREAVLRLAVLLGVFTLLALYFRRGTALVLIAAGIAAALALTGWITLPRRTVRARLNTVRRLIAEGKRPYPARMDVEFGNDGITVSTDEGVGKTAYKDVAYAGWSDDRLFLMSVNREGVMLPKRCLDGRADEVTALLRRKLLPERFAA